MIFRLVELFLIKNELGINFFLEFEFWVGWVILLFSNCFWFLLGGGEGGGEGDCLIGVDEVDE